MAAFFLLRSAVVGAGIGAAFGMPSVYINTGTRIPGVLDAPIYDVDGVTKLDGGSERGRNFQAVYYFGNSLESLAGVQAFEIGGGTNAGYVFASSVSMAAPPDGHTIYCQIKVWDHRVGNGTWEGALAAGAVHGQSEVIPVNASTNSAAPAPLTGLKPVKLVNFTAGTVDARNLVPGQVDAPVFDSDGVTRLAGAAFKAQIFARLAGGHANPVPLGDPFSFGTGATAGYWDLGTNPVLMVTNVPAGDEAEIRVRVWEAAKGATFEQATGAAAKRGESAPIVVFTGGDGAPPTPAPLLNGLAPFSLAGSAWGAVNFNNFVPGKLDVPVTIFSPFLHPPVQNLAAPYVAQLYAGPDAGHLLPMGTPAHFGADATAGYWQGGTVLTTNVQAGAVATVAVRVWDGSQFDTYEKAVSQGYVGTSDYFVVQTGGAGSPPGEPAVLHRFHGVDLHGQHYVTADFRNRIPGILDNPVLGPDGDRLAGSRYVAQLYGQVFREDFHPLGTPAPFGTGADAGYWQPGENNLIRIDVPAGCCANVQVRIWDTTYGATFEEAAGGPQAISAATFLFADNEDAGVLNRIGLISMVRYARPAIVMSDVPRIVDVGSNDPLKRPGFVAQLSVAPDNPPGTFGAIDRTNFVAVGPQAPVANGQWQLPVNTVFLLPPPFQLSQRIVVELDVWDSAKGSTFDEALKNGGITGRSAQISISTPGSLVEPPAGFTLYSVGIIGITRKLSAPPGFSLISNPLWPGNGYYNITQALPNAPEGTVVYVFNPVTQGYDVTRFDFGRWSYYSPLPAGRGFFIFNPRPTPLELTFIGVEDPYVAPATPPHGRQMFQAVGCSGAGPRQIADLLPFPLLPGDTAYRFVNGQWQTSDYEVDGWPGPSSLAPGEAVFLRLQPRP